MSCNNIVAGMPLSIFNQAYTTAARGGNQPELLSLSMLSTFPNVISCRLMPLLIAVGWIERGRGS